MIVNLQINLHTKPLIVALIALIALITLLNKMRNTAFVSRFACHSSESLALNTCTYFRYSDAVTLDTLLGLLGLLGLFGLFPPPDDELLGLFELLP